MGVLRDDDSDRFDARKKFDKPTDGSRTSWVKHLDREKVDKGTYKSDLRGIERQLKDAKEKIDKKADDTVVNHIKEKAEESKRIALAVNKKFNERQCGQLGRFEAMEKMHVEAKMERDRILGKIEKALSFRVVAVLAITATIAGTGFGYARAFGKVEEAQESAKITDGDTKKALKSMSDEVTKLKIAVEDSQAMSEPVSLGDNEKDLKRIAKEVLEQYDKERRRRRGRE